MKTDGRTVTHLVTQMNEIGDQNVGQPPRVEVFKFRNLIWSCLMVVVLFATCIVASLAFVPVVELFNASAIIALGFVVFVFLEYATVTQQADIHITDNGISRVLFGRTLQSIRWDNVDRIRTQRLVNPSLEWSWRGTTIRAFFIVPCCKDGSWFTRPKAIAFFEKAENMERLISLLNRYISKHNLTIEAYSGLKMDIIKQL